MMALKVREVNREKLFTGFVKPAFDSLDAAHKSYLECFRNYPDVITSTGTISDNDIGKLKDMLKNN